MIRARLSSLRISPSLRIALVALALNGVSLGVTPAADPVLVIYNSGFALVRQEIELDLHAGENTVSTTAVTKNLDPASVILRDPSGKKDWQIIEQTFRGNPISEEAMLARFEGKTLPFQFREYGADRVVQTKILRASSTGRSDSETIFEIDGKIQFHSAGTPIFPALPDDAVLKPELRWKLSASKPVKTRAEFSYLTEGISWTADYNAVVRDEGKISELTGWITLKNDTKTSFPMAQVKLIAGDIKRLSRGEEAETTTERVVVTGSYIPTSEIGSVLPEERVFDEAHEFSLPRPIALSEAETTQTELVRATDITLVRSYIYDGSNLQLGSRYDDPQLDPTFGVDSNPKVLITTEFRNDGANHLGLPLPKGRLHFYRNDAEGRLQFTGDSAIDNTAQGEMVRAVTGNAFDLVGERRQTDFRVDEEKRTVEESFEIKLRNHRKEAVEVRVVEHPARWRQWEITAQSPTSKKIDARTIEFRVPVKAGEESVATYTIRYAKLPRPRE